MDVHEQKDLIAIIKQTLREHVPELILLGLQSNKSELSGLMSDVKKQLSVISNDLISVKNDVSALNEKVKIQNGRVLKTEEKVYELEKINIRKDGEEEGNRSFWKEKIFWGCISIVNVLGAVLWIILKKIHIINI